eukprot:TRINITY_DN7044_c0_g1_i1.p1 TRINITY_DN7044_c0_g1~~TRINITY_DN7044_c0_g1_i1.p1  ORF type:complete len:193 (-),score=32.63 TRINITY_DN7044_c0_g1_i1:187-765(-)
MSLKASSQVPREFSQIFHRKLDARLQALPTKADVSLRSLLSSNDFTLIVPIMNMLNPLNRVGLSLTWDIKEYLKRHIRPEWKIGMVGICFDSEHAEEVLKGDYFAGDVYVDPEKLLKESLYPVKKGILNSLACCASKLTRKGGKSDLIPSWKSGKFLLVGRDGIVYLNYAPTNYSDIPDMATIIDIISSKMG